MIKGMLFDLGQTLLDSADGFRSAEKEAQKRIFSDFASTQWEDFIANYRRLRRFFQDRSNFSRRAIWKALYEHYGQEPDMSLLEKWEDDYWETVTTQTTLFGETERVLEILISEYRVALVTNTQGQRTSGKHRIRQFPEIERLFEVIIVAGESGVPAKPDPVPFLLGLECLGIHHSEAVYVGDDWRIDICGARNVGIRPIWIQHHSVHRSWPLVETSVPIITSLDPLLSLESIVP